MAIKRNLFLKRLALIGIDLGQISVKLTFYSVIAAVVFTLGGGFLVVLNPNPLAIVFYTVFMVTFTILQIVQMLRRDREKNIQDGFMTDVDYFIHNGRKIK